MTQSSWPNLLVEPKAILGPYQSVAPSLASFAPHSVRIDFDNVSVAGQFFDLPKTPSEKWRYGEKVRAYAVFQFVEVGKLQMKGLLTRALGDGALHGEPEGQVGKCALEAIQDQNSTIEKRKFVIETSTFNLEVEASYVYLYCGRQAFSQHGWINAV